MTKRTKNAINEIKKLDVKLTNYDNLLIAKSYYMNGEYENPSMNERLLAFYDYNPATQKMTPEPELTDMVEEKVKGFASWVMRLPDKGKDIEVYVYQENDDDSEDELEFDMEWNGQSFTIESIEDFED